LRPEDAQLVSPDARYAASFLDALREGFRRGSQPTASPARIAAITSAFGTYLDELTEPTGSIRLPGGELVPKVPFSIHWLVAGDVFVGELSLRHELNEVLRQSGGHIGYGIRPSLQGRGFGRRILALGLAEARRLGILRVLVTAHPTNAASCRVIEANAGMLEDTVEDIYGSGPLRRYWIELRGDKSPVTG
jgi:predicted acetyltransferase